MFYCPAAVGPEAWHCILPPQGARHCVCTANVPHTEVWHCESPEPRRKWSSISFSASRPALAQCHTSARGSSTVPYPVPYSLCEDSTVPYLQPQGGGAREYITFLGSPLPAPEVVLRWVWHCKSFARGGIAQWKCRARRIIPRIAAGPRRARAAGRGTLEPRRRD